MALYPKGDQPYMCGLSQCSYPRVWTPQEERLFQEIGRRLEDALTSLLMLHNLGESERKLEEAQRIAHVGHWERDADTDAVTWSDETYRIFGLRPQERIVNFAAFRALIHPDDRQAVAEAMAALRGDRRYDMEYRVARPNGEVRLVHAQGALVTDDAGRPRRRFGTVQDITERKRAEQRLMAQHTVTQTLAEAATLEEATPKILQAVCECLDWDLGTLWSLDRHAGGLRCVAPWQKASVAPPRLPAPPRAPPRLEWAATALAGAGRLPPIFPMSSRTQIPPARPSPHAKGCTRPSAFPSCSAATSWESWSSSATSAGRPIRTFSPLWRPS